MATKRDPEKTARNKVIKQMSSTLKEWLPTALSLSGAPSDQSLHGIYGGKHDFFIDMKNAVIHTPEQFVNLWLEGYIKRLKELAITKGPWAKKNGLYTNFLLLKNNPQLFQYVELFLRRTFLREFDALARTRPTIEHSSIWIGQNNASYGLLVTPRFSKGNWENDKSEIRHFSKDYWTIGHVLKTGLVIPKKDDKIVFKDLDQYLSFFENTLVRASGSPHEMKIAEMYSKYVRSAPNPEKVPLLIPELRYAGLSGKHEYRLDFCVIDPFTMRRVGFELSPWSTHGAIKATKGKTQKVINDEAKKNFEKEMAKLKKYFKNQDIYTLIYTDTDLENHDQIFSDIEHYLSPDRAAQQLKLTIRSEFLKFSIS